MAAARPFRERPPVEETFEAQAWTGGRGHHGSRLVFDHDGHLFITVGDRQSPPSGNPGAHPSQDLTNHLDGELRIRDVRQGPDGYIHIAVDDRGGGRTPIVRLEPAD